MNENAVVKIYEAKERPRFNPMIVHIYDIDELNNYAEDIPDEAYKLAEKFSPGPLTFILKKKNVIPDIVTAGNDSVGLRIPAHEIFREVVKLSGVPIAAPSANKSGMISPTSADDVLKELNGKVSYILDGGKCGIGIESTVISLLDNEIKILRHGFVTKEEIEKVTGKISDDKSEIKSDKFISPGLLKSHYAPKTPFYITENTEEVKKAASGRTGFLDFSKYKNKKEIAVNLFSEMRKLDEQSMEIIVGEKVDNTGLGIAINDRLERACSGTIEVVNGNILIKNFNK